MKHHAMITDYKSHQRKVLADFKDFEADLNKCANNPPCLEALDIADRILFFDVLAPQNLDRFNKSDYRLLKTHAYQSRFIADAAQALRRYRKQLRLERDRVAHVRRERNIVTSRYAQLFIKIGRRDGFLCAHCEQASKDLQIDHVIPVSAGGLSVLENLQLLCLGCNSVKGATVPTMDS